MAATVSGFLLFVVAGLALVNGGVITRSLLNEDLVTTKIYFEDYDKTTAICSYGRAVLDVCESYKDVCNETGDMTTAYAYIVNDTLGRILNDSVNASVAFGGPARIAQMIEFFEEIINNSESNFEHVFILSTSWTPVPAAEWARFIFATFQTIGFDAYFPLANILTLDDPGIGISADKGGRIYNKSQDLNYTIDECLFSDDSSGNIQSAVNNCDTLYVSERAGLDGTDLEYVIARSRLTKPLDGYTSEEPTSSPTTASPTTPSPTSATASDSTFLPGSKLKYALLVVVVPALAYMMNLFH